MQIPDWELRKAMASKLTRTAEGGCPHMVLGLLADQTSTILG
jgi:hypothetical protein